MEASRLSALLTPTPLGDAIGGGAAGRLRPLLRSLRIGEDAAAGVVVEGVAPE